MDPYVAFLLSFSTFVAGVFIGWHWRELHLWQEIKKGNFDPYKWGRKES